LRSASRGNSRPRSWTNDRHAQIVLDGEVRKNPPTLGHVADSFRRDAKRRPVGDVAAKNSDVTTPRRCQSHHAAQGRRLAGSIASQQCCDLAFGGTERNVVQDVALAVVSVQALYFKRVHSDFPK
jgi:hypothetical protein